MGCASSKAVAADPRTEIEFFGKYDLGEVLGQGAYGTVHVACCAESGERLAVKTLDLNSGKKHPVELIKDVNAEERAWARIGCHPNVVGLRETFIDDSFAYFVMELCTGTLFTALSAETVLNEYTYARYFRDMALALAHIHSVGVVHGDVKQDNFIVGAPDGRTVKLCDFGLSAVVVGNGKLSRQVGTAPYMAPEMVSGKYILGPPADVWSFGVIVYIAFFGCWPYQPRLRTTQEMRKANRDGTFPPMFAPPRKFSQNVVSQASIDFVKALLNRNQFTRPDAASCLEMAYLNQRHCNQLQANGTNEGMISLTPQFLAAVQFGAFNTKTPKLDEGQELHLMNLQSTAQSRRVSFPASADGTSRSTTIASPKASEPWLSEVQSMSTGEGVHVTVM